MRTVQEWEDFSRYNKQRADAEIRSSNRLREAMQHTVQQTRNDVLAQREAVDFQLKKRLHETERAKDEMQWQKKKVGSRDVPNDYK